MYRDGDKFIVRLSQVTSLKINEKWVYCLVM